MAGAVEGVATNVPVKDNSNEAQAATAYGDNTFARENVTLLNGNNTLTAVAEDNYVPSANNCSIAFFAASHETIWKGNCGATTCAVESQGPCAGTFSAQEASREIQPNRTKSFTCDPPFRRHIRPMRPIIPTPKTLSWDQMGLHGSKFSTTDH
jgi:hypothetical protein